MRRVVVVFVSVLFAIICVIGLFFVQGNTLIKEEVDILDIQRGIDEYINVYGYTMDNPSIIVDPYGENFNTALIMFETDDYVSVSVSVNNSYSYSTNVTKRHYIGLYGLNEGDNNVRLSYLGNSKDFVVNVVRNEDSKYIDVNSGVILENNHLIVPIEKYISEGVYVGFKEVDVFGKVYYEYILEDGYSGLVCEVDSLRLAYFVDNFIFVIDRQENSVIVSYDVSEYLFDWKNIEYNNDKLFLYSDEVVVSIDGDGNINRENVLYSSKGFSGDVNYRKVSGVRFSDDKVTTASDKRVWLFNYKKYDKDDIEIKKEFNRLVVSSEREFDLVLDKLLGRKVYELNKGINYIYTGGLDGKYSVYYVIDDRIYKTNSYVEF